MKIPYYQVDAFASKLFSGNPAGVCLLASWLPDHTLQSIAAENNIAETAFVYQRDSHFELRWFTPTMEIDLCGHATLAPAHVLFHELGLQQPQIRFQTRSGMMPVTREGEILTLDFPSRPAKPCATPPDLLKGLGSTPLFIAKSRDYLAVFETERAIRELKPDFTALSQLDALGIIVTAPGNGCDFVSRFFAPRAGVLEDPATGSSHCSLIPYWSERTGKTHMKALQLSQRGGEMFCEQRGDRVGIGGRAVTYSSGYLHLP